jgi:hypothetical protein
MVSTTCPLCSNALEIETKYIGKGIMCPFCQKLFVPPMPHSGVGLAAIALAGVAVLIELLVLAYFVSGVAWNTGFERIRGVMVFGRFLGLILSWMGIACGVLGMLHRKRRRDAARWGLIVNVLVNVFVWSWLLFRPDLGGHGRLSDPTRPAVTVLQGAIPAPAARAPVESADS